MFVGCIPNVGGGGEGGAGSMLTNLRFVGKAGNERPTQPRRKFKTPSPKERNRELRTEKA
eukprot:3267474-Amphidinium_carterae.1